MSEPDQIAEAIFQNKCLEIVIDSINNPEQALYSKENTIESKDNFRYDSEKVFELFQDLCEKDNPKDLKEITILFAPPMIREIKEWSENAEVQSKYFNYTVTLIPTPTLKNDKSVYFFVNKLFDTKRGTIKLQGFVEKREHYHRINTK